MTFGVDKRNVIKLGEAMSVTLPKQWVGENNIKPKDEITMVHDNDFVLLLPPNQEKVVLEKLSSRFHEIANEFVKHSKPISGGKSN